MMKKGDKKRPGTNMGGWPKGKPRSAETRERMSESWRASPARRAHLEKMIASNTGRKYSPEELANRKRGRELAREAKKRAMR
jgi:hypothetical protein